VPRPLIHVGYHKTGSSYLQQELFSGGKSRLRTVWGSSECFERLIFVNPFEFSPEAARDSYLDALAGLPEDAVPVITAEALSGNPYEGEYPSGAIAERVTLAFPDGRILIVVREQVSMLTSWYKHCVRAGLEVKVGDFLRQVPASSGFKPHCRLEFLEYHYLAELYQRLLGEENVLVLPWEMLRKEASSFIERICSFANVPAPAATATSVVNPGYGGFTTSMMRYANALSGSDRRRTSAHRSAVEKLKGRAFYRLDRLAPRSLERSVGDSIRNQIREGIGEHRYAESNRRLEKATGIDLQEFGYDRG
jgi:hypothetical protein